MIKSNLPQVDGSNVMREILDPETTFDGETEFFGVDVGLTASHGGIDVIVPLIFEPSLNINDRTRADNKGRV